MRIKKGDKVIVIAGKDKGAQGEVLQVAPEKRKILVEGVNLIKKHIPAEKTKKGGRVGQRIELPAFFDISNVKLICPNCGKPAKVGYGLSRSLDSDDFALSSANASAGPVPSGNRAGKRDDKKERICKKCGKAIESQNV